MATKTKTKTQTAATLQQLNPADVAPHPKNPRHSLGDLKELTASIAEQGVLEPVVVEPFPDDVDDGARQWLLIHGHRRLAAAQAAGLDTVPAIVHPVSTLEDQVSRMLVENLQRAGLTAVEEGDAYQELLDLGWDTATISQRVSRPKRKVTDLVKVAGLPESARERISEGQLTLEDASRMAKFAKDAGAVEELQESAGVSKWAFEQTLARIEKRKQQEREIAKWKKDVRAKGVKVLSGEELDELEEYSDLEDLPASAIGAAADLDPDTDDFEAEWERLALIGHASCPGAFAWVESGSWGVIRHLCCSQPSLHDRRETAPASATNSATEAERAALEERRAQHEQAERDRAELRLKLAAAGVARRHFLGDVLNAPEAEDVAKAIALDSLAPFLARKTEWSIKQQRILAEVVFPNATQDSLDKPGLADRLRKAFAGMTVTQLVLAYQVSERVQHEEGLSTRTQPWTATESYQVGTKWRHELTKTWGYRWSEFEQELIDGAHAGSA